MSERYIFRLPREIVAVRGPESATYLQGQLSQDVLGLADGGSAWSWLLAPNGKVDALLRVTRCSTDEWLLDTDAGYGEAVLSRLARFKLRTKVDLEPADLAVYGLRGPGWDLSAVSGIVVSPPWPGVEGADVIGAEPAADGARLATPERYEFDRISAAIPRMGAELDERTIPAETGLVALTVSFTKGCYTGQELVARIDSRGSNVARHMRRFRFPSPVDPGAELQAADGRAAGIVTSSAPAPGGHEGWVGLGFVRRAVEPDAPLVAGSVPVTQLEPPR